MKIEPVPLNEQDQAVIAAIRRKGPLASADDVFVLVESFFNGKRGSFSSKIGSMVKRKTIFSGSVGKKTVLSLEMIPGQEGREDASLFAQEKLRQPTCLIADIYTRGLVEAMEAARVPGRRPVTHVPT